MKYLLDQEVHCFMGKPCQALKFLIEKNASTHDFKAMTVKGLPRRLQVRNETITWCTIKKEEVK